MARSPSKVGKQRTGKVGVLRPYSTKQKRGRGTKFPKGTKKRPLDPLPSDVHTLPPPTGTGAITLVDQAGNVAYLYWPASGDKELRCGPNGPYWSNL